MDRQELLDLFTRQMRIEGNDPDSFREQTPEVVRHIARQEGAPSWLIYSHLDETNAERVIEEQVAYFERLGREFEWKVFDYDTPPDLVERLRRRGFQIEEREALLVLDIESAPANLLTWHSGLLAPPLKIQRLERVEQVRDVRTVEEAVWGENHAWVEGFIGGSMAERPDQISAYVIYEDPVPVSCAWLIYYPGSQFAGLWGGSTLPAYRGRGCYTALLAARLQEAQARAVRFLMVDASPMSSPILQKYGFQVLGYSNPCHWKIKAKRA